MLKKFVRVLGGDPNKKILDKYNEVIDRINALESKYENLTDEELRAKTDAFRSEVAGRISGSSDEKERQKAEQEALADILEDAFAAVREASKRTIGLRHYDVQLIGGIALHEGRIAEMRTGEGKTLVATLPLYLNALTGRGVHLITVNDYLARRDARWMAPIYNALGLTVGVLQMAARTEHGKKAFLVDLERESPHEDQDKLIMVNRVEAYAADITYGTNSEFGFDYLRDNMTMSLSNRVQRGHYYAIIDEVDNVLIDEARTPLIISGPAQDESDLYVRMAQVIRRLNPEDYELNEKDRNITLTEIGEAHVEELLGVPLRDPDRPEDVTPEQARLMGNLEQALRAQFLFKRNKDYLVQGGKVIIIDEFTGRLMPGRRWSDGLHQAVEAKESVKVEPENVTYATITIQNYFRMYQKLSGMTGTALTEAEEFDKIYKLEVLAIPTNLEYQASRSESDLVVAEDKDEYGYKYQFYTRKDDAARTPVYWRRKDYPDVVYRTEEAKFRSVTREILAYHSMGRPLLVGTTSVELSERLSNRLRAEPLRRLAQTILIRDAWMKQNKREEDGRQIVELQHLHEPLENLQTSDLRKLANEVGISINPEDVENINHLGNLLGLEAEDHERLLGSLKAGIPHEVLNARKHTEESQIITGAGAFGAVTIATNMAGRGVDIKLGGEMAEELMAAVNRVLRRAGYEDAFEMSMEARRRALLMIDPSEYGIYEGEVRYFLQQLEDMERVKALGGLHVIGSERHEARRIDNQLRGRAARQGDPGSSRFYLSLEDELMRRFGGQQANDLMQRLKVDDAMPIEFGIVGRIVEQSQNRVEGSNFDVRKHLLEYDDVLNTQRNKIYEQRNRIFVKDDLSDDVTGMLRAEVNERVPKALKADEGPWELLAWLEQVQPPFTVDGQVYPSFALRLLVDQLLSQTSKNGQDDLKGLLDIAEEAIRAEEAHLLNSVGNLIDSVHDRLNEQIQERREAVDTFFEGLELADETDTRGPRELTEELSTAIRMNVKLSPEQAKALRNDPQEMRKLILNQIESMVNAQTMVRLIGAIERRIGESLEANPSQFNWKDWDDLSDQVYAAVQSLLDRRRERFLGSNSSEGQIVKDIRTIEAREKEPLTDADKDQLTQALENALLSADSSRERILQELDVALSRLQGNLGIEDRETLRDSIETAATSTAGPPLRDKKEEIIQALRESTAAIEDKYQKNRLLRMLMSMPVGTVTSFDKKTHQKVTRRTMRLNFVFYAAKFQRLSPENREPQEITEDVLAHLEGAQAAMRKAWGRSEWQRLSAISPKELEEKTQAGLQRALGVSGYSQIETQPLLTMPAEFKAAAIDELGRQALTEIYRQLLLGVITELWVDYLTQMESLRVSIGLEAYAQRDPLVQYKSRAFELFQTLLKNMRLGVVTRMFTYRPRSQAAQAAVRKGKEDELPEEQVEQIEEQTGSDEDSVVEEAKKTPVLESGSEPKQHGQPVSKSKKRRRSRR